MIIYLLYFPVVSNVLRKRFYKLCLRKELLCYFWNEFGGRVVMLEVEGVLEDVQYIGQLT